LLTALILIVAVLSALLWAEFTYDSEPVVQVSAITLPLPPPPAGGGEAAGAAPPPAATPNANNDGGADGAPSGDQSGQAPPGAAQPAGPPAAPAHPNPAAQAPAQAPIAPTVPPSPPANRTETATPAPQALPTGPESLTPAPDAALIEHGKDGPLPIVAADGRKARLVYARPYDATNPRPRIAIIVSDLGQSTAATEAAIQNLPGSVTLAFNPYGQRLDYWAARARAAGHEVLTLVPMEPVNYPANDPGPQTLLTTLTSPENRERLNWSLSRFTGYVGVLSLAGSRYTTALESIRPTLEEINGRGLLFVDSRSSLRSSAFRIAGEIGLPRAINNRFIDVQASRDDIDRRLDELVKLASNSGFAVGIGQPYPATIERVAAFVRTADDRGLSIAPVSAIVDRQKE
jgi:uncharacterized protein